MNKKNLQLFKGMTKRAIMPLVLASGFVITTIDANAQYCIPSFSYGCDEDLIDDFTIPSLAFSHLGTGCSPSQYGDYTSMNIGEIVAGTSHAFTITSAYEDGIVRGYIDFNNDEEFSPDELVISNSVETGFYEYEGDIVVPNTAPAGTYRIRVLYIYDDEPTPCNEYGFGEAHDYMVTILPSPCDPIIATYNIVPNCAGNSFSVSIEISDMGGSSPINITDGVLNVTASVVGTYLIGNYASGTTSTITLEHSVDEICNKIFAGLTSDCQPINDEATGAISLIVGAGCSAPTYTNVNASNSASEPNSPLSTQISERKVWFKFVAPASGAVRVSTAEAEGSLEDTRITLFSTSDVSDYTTFVAIAADDDNAPNSSYGGFEWGYRSIIYATGLVAGNEYYVMLEGYSDTEEGTFCLSVEELAASMLSTDNTCDSETQSIEGSGSSYMGLVSLVDAYGKLIATVRNPTGGYAEDYYSSQSINTGAIRSDESGRTYLDRNFTIDNFDISSTVEVTLFFLDSELSAMGESIETVNISKVSGSSCEADFAGTADLLLQTNNGSVGGVSWIGFNTTSFSNFYVSEGSSPLPLIMGNITAQNQGTVNAIRWNTLDEREGSKMSLERSKDGRVFEKIQDVKINNTPSSYQYLDEKPYAGNNLYRVKLENADGSSIYSTVANAYVKDGSQNIKIFPNPSKGQFTIELTATSRNAKVFITDVMGRTVFTVDHVDANAIQVDIAKLASGVYFVNYKDDERTSVIKITKE